MNRKIFKELPVRRNFFPKNYLLINFSKTLFLIANSFKDTIRWRSLLSLTVHSSIDLYMVVM